MMRMLPVDSAVTVFANSVPLTDDTDFKTRETAVAHNAAGMDLVWNFQTTAGVITQTAVTPTTAGVYDWTHVGDGMYQMEIPASGGASINNDTEGYGFFSGVATGVLPWVGPTYAFVPAHVVNGLVSGTDNLQTDTVQFGGTNGTFASGRPQVNMTHVNGTAYTSSGLGVLASLESGSIDSGTFSPTSSQFYVSGLSLTGYSNAYKGSILKITSGTCSGSFVAITASSWTGSYHDLSIYPSLPTTPAGGDSFVVIPGCAVSDVYQWGGSPTSSANVRADVRQYGGTNGTFSSGRPEVNAVRIGGQTASASGTITFPNATLASTTNITAGTITTVTNLTNAPTAGDLTATMKASVNAEVDAAIETYHLDHLLAADYDPASKPGASTALLNELVESDAGVSRFTANALEQAPSAGGGTDWTANERTAIRSILGIPASGTTPDDPTTGILDTIRDAVVVVDGVVDSILEDTGTSGVVVAAGSKTGYSLTAGTGLGNQTADITGSLSGSVGSVTGSVGSVAGNVGGNVVGSVNSVTSGVTVSTNNDKTGYSLTAGTGLGNQTANITGNLSGSVGSVTGGINTAAGTITTLDALDTAQDSQHSTTQTSLTTVGNNVTSILADTGTDGVVLSTATLNAIADALLLRNASNTEATAGEHTLTTIILAMLESSRTGTTWTINRTNGSTVHATKTLTVDADADPITGVT